MMQSRDAAITAWLKGGDGRQLKSLYDELRRRWRALPRPHDPFPYATEGSLRVTIRKWRRGERHMEEHPALQHLLAEVLGVDHAVLFPPKVVAVQSHPMLGFEALGAIDPRADEPCVAPTLRLVRAPQRERYGRPSDRPCESLFSRHLRRGLHWVTAPPGAGRSLATLAREPVVGVPPPPGDVLGQAWSLFGSSPPPHVVRTATLEGLRTAAAFGANIPLVLKVERPGPGGTDPPSDLGKRDDVVIFASFPAPRLVDETDAGYAERWGAWSIWQWAPDAAWRSAFVAWVGERIRRRHARTALVEASVMEWLDRVDPELERYATPSDLLPILGLAHQHGADDLPDRVDLDLGWRHLTIVHEGRGDDARGRWLAAQGAATTLELIRAAWRSPQFPWPPRLTEAEAASLLPTSTLPSFDERLVEVERLATSLKGRLSPRNRAETHRRIDALVKAIDRPAELVQVLVEVQTLRPVGEGRVSPGPRWVQELAALDALAEDLPRHDRVVSWGRLAVDTARQPLIDRALGELSSSAFFDVLKAVLNAHKEGVLGSIGAIETLFIAASHRTAAARTSTEKAGLLERLWRAQRPLLVRSATDRLAAPRTRGGPGESRRGGALWWAACWAWSLGPMKRPEGLPGALAWLFPGWFDEIGEVPYDLSCHRQEPDADDPAAEAEGVARMFELAPRFIERWTGEVGKWSAPDVVVAAAVPAAARRGWRLGPLARGLLQREDALSEHVARAIEDLKAEDREGVITALWEVALEPQVLSDALWPVILAKKQPGQTGSLGALMLRSFPVDTFVRRISERIWWGADSCKRLLQAAPPSHVAELTRALIMNDARREEVVEALLDDPNAFLDLLVEAAPLLPAASGVRVATCLWQHAPDRAEALADAAWSERGETSPWMEGVGAGQQMSVARILLRHPDRPAPERFLRWLARSIPDLGARADQVFDLLQTQGWSALAFEPARG